MEPLSHEDADARLPELAPNWRREGDALVCERECANFLDAIGLVNRIAEVAERANHHPDLLVHSYKQLRITLSTHSAGGLTDNDFALAAEINGL
ncbi:MAG: 4a-hydroxytetrahydrobiopterin dehydratase [Solirubrobacteraceae bacterium]